MKNQIKETSSPTERQAFWRERGAVIYSLIASCKLGEIDPFEYLHDVLDRVSTHPASTGSCSIVLPDEAPLALSQKV